MIAYGAHKVMAHETPLITVKTVPPICVFTRRVENNRMAKVTRTNIQIWVMVNYRINWFAAGTRSNAKNRYERAVGRIMNWRRRFATRAIIANRKVANVPTWVLILRNIFVGRWNVPEVHNDVALESCLSISINSIEDVMMTDDIHKSPT